MEDIWSLLRLKNSKIFQRSRARWLKEGDANSAYFHACVKKKGRINSILKLQVGDRWVEEVVEVRQEVVVSILIKSLTLMIVHWLPHSF